MAIDGRYFERKKLEAGTMGTVNLQVNDLHYYIRELDGGDISVEMVTKAGKSSGVEIDKVTKEEFSRRFQPCTEHDCEFIEKTEEQLKIIRQKKIEDVAEEHLSRKEFVSAEFEFNKALKLNEESVRSNYGMGKVYLETGRVEKAKKIFNKLSKIEALFNDENKHVFNEFGIDLRKQKMYDEAIMNYEKAIKISPDDEILYYNLGRGYKEKGDLKTAIYKLELALKLNSDFKEAKEYITYLKSKLNKQNT